MTNMRFASLAFFTALLLAIGAPRGIADDLDAQVKRIAERVNSVETQLDRAVLYEKITDDAAAGSSLTEQAWLTEAADWLKIHEDRVNKAGRQLTELWFGKENALIFRLRREEKPQPDGTTQVLESRCYYDGGALVRELRKEAWFKAGESTDTKQIKNLTLPIAKLTEEERRSSKQQEMARDYIARLTTAGPANRDPSATAGGDSSRFQLIHDSTSPDGRYAVGIGFAEAPKSWDDLYLLTEDVPERDSYWVEDSDLREKLRNYVIDLTTHRIVGETGGDAYGTRTSVGRGSWSFSWSPDSRWLAQVTSDKWASGCKVVALDPEKGVVASGDLGEAAQQATMDFLKAKKDRALKMFGSADAVSVKIYTAEVTNDGQLTLSLQPTDAGSSKSWENPVLVERFQLKTSGKEVGAKFLDARYR